MQVCGIFHSLQGECLSQGAPTTFVRFAGCNLSCGYCDTAYAQSSTEGTMMSSSAILDRIQQFEQAPARVCLTGGEPLLQPRSELIELITLLQESHRTSVSIETNGSQVLDWLMILRKRQIWKLPLVVDYKLGDLRQLMVWSNFTHLQSQDVLKFVCQSEDDLARVVEVLQRLASVHGAHPVVYVHSVGGVPSKFVVDHVLELHKVFSGRFDIRYGIQLHKLLWGDERGK